MTRTLDSNGQHVLKSCTPRAVKGALSEEGKGADKKKVVTASEIKVQ
jgi:hypothetical protein